MGWGSLISDGFWPQVHSDALQLLPWAHCSGLQAAFDPSPDGLVGQACTGKRWGREKLHAAGACTAAGCCLWPP